MREAQGLSIDAVARRAGIDRRTVMHVEHGTSGPRGLLLSTVHALSHALSIPLWVLLAPINEPLEEPAEQPRTEDS